MECGRFQGDRDADSSHLLGAVRLHNRSRSSVFRLKSFASVAPFPPRETTVR